MKKTMRVAAAIICLLFCISVAGCGSNADEDVTVNTKLYEDMKYTDDDMLPTGIVAENDTWELHWHKGFKRVEFYEKGPDGQVIAKWGTVPFEAAYREDGGLKRSNVQMESAIKVLYHNPTNMAEEGSLSRVDADQEGNIYALKIENGLRVVYDFVGYGIMVPVDYVIEEDRFTVSVDPTQIADRGKSGNSYQEVRYTVSGVELAPFMCGVQNAAEDSWLFLPDGAGAIVKPNDMATVGDMGSAHVYGEDLSVQNYYYTSKTQQNLMPVFGAKKGDKAIVGIIDSGVEAASINWNIGSENIGYSTVYASFSFRGYRLTTPPRGYSGAQKYIKLMTDYIDPTPARVAYYTLQGEKASISGMAEVYRNYLIKNGDLKKSTAEEKSVAFKYMGGTEQPDFVLGLPSTKLFPLTTTEQAEKMTTELAEKLGKDFYVDMFGYGTSGVDTGEYAGGFKTAGELGGDSGMAQLSATMDKLGIPWYMDFDLITMRKGSNGYSADNDTVRWNNQQVAYFHGFNALNRRAETDDRTYILGRDQLVGAAQKLLDETEDLKLKGISLDTLSHVIYSDYCTSKYSLSSEMANDAQTIINNIKAKGYTFLADAANDYAAGVADAIIDAPLYSSLYDFTDYDVPFYQMVLRGYVPMSSVSINLCGDETDALLRCVRAGISPSYTLTYNYDNELISSDHSFIFGSSYEGNKERIVETVNGVKEYLQSIEGATITEYVNLTDDVTVTTFSNGVYAVVNTGETDASTAYGDVAAGTWITGGVAQ